MKAYLPMTLLKIDTFVKIVSFFLSCFAGQKKLYPNLLLYIRTQMLGQILAQQFLECKMTSRPTVELFSKILN